MELDRLKVKDKFYIPIRNKIYNCKVMEITDDIIVVEISIKDFIAYGRIKPDEVDQHLFKTKKDAEKYLKEHKQ